TPAASPRRASMMLPLRRRRVNHNAPFLFHKEANHPFPAAATMTVETPAHAPPTTLRRAAESRHTEGGGGIDEHDHQASHRTWRSPDPPAPRAGRALHLGRVGQILRHG